MVALRTGREVRDVVMGVFNPRERAHRWIEVSAVPLFRTGERDPHQVFSLFGDVTERRRADEALRESERRHRDLFEKMTEGFAVHEIVCDASGAAVDYRFLEVNPAFERLTGLSREKVLGHLLSEVLPGDNSVWIQAYGRVALTGEPIQFDSRADALGRHYDVFAFCPRPRQFAVLFVDVTERKRAEERLARGRPAEERVPRASSRTSCATRSRRSGTASTSSTAPRPDSEQASARGRSSGARRSTSRASSTTCST